MFFFLVRREVGAGTERPNAPLAELECFLTRSSPLINMSYAAASCISTCGEPCTVQCTAANGGHLLQTLRERNACRHAGVLSLSIDY